ncbi:hypothetical protein [Streptomyces sp. NPDC002994]
MTTTPPTTDGSRHIPFERLHNVRDLGGYRTTDDLITRLRAQLLT